MSTAVSYHIGSPRRPAIYHDNGFLDRFSRRAPTLSDKAKYAEWTALLEAAEAAQRVPLVPHNDLPDALAAYRHFLFGKGADRTFSYERYVAFDYAGKMTLDNAILDLRRGVESLSAQRPVGSGPSFEVTSGPIPCGSTEPYFMTLFPYPSTENWQKALGSHMIWLSGRVTVSGTGTNCGYVVLMTLHAEDRYNFNPGALDIATGIPDSANGVFEVTGLAQQYMNYSTLTRMLRWTGVTVVSPEASRLSKARARQPGDNRRIRNRI